MYSKSLVQKIHQFPEMDFKFLNLDQDFRNQNWLQIRYISADLTNRKLLEITNQALDPRQCCALSR